MKVPVSLELAAAAPLTGWTLINAFVVAYSPIIMLGMGVVFFTAQMLWRYKEHKQFMKKNEVRNG